MRKALQRVKNRSTMSAEKGARRDADEEAENVERRIAAAEATAAHTLRIAVALEALLGTTNEDPPRNNPGRLVAAAEALAADALNADALSADSGADDNAGQ